MEAESLRGHRIAKLFMVPMPTRNIFWILKKQVAERREPLICTLCLPCYLSLHFQFSPQLKTTSSSKDRENEEKSSGDP